MARKFLQDIRGQISSSFPDNTEGLITAANARELYTDMLDSMTELRGEIFKTTPQDNFTPGTTFSPITGYDEANDGDPSFLILNPVTGTITSGNTGGFSYRILGQIQFIGDNNEQWEVGIAGGGVVSTFIAGVTSRGNNKPLTAIVAADVFNGANNASIDLRIRSVDSATEQIDIQQASLFAALLPTEAPGPVATRSFP